jgi:hypothetical protein
MSSVALAVSGGALALASLLLKRASERDKELLRDMCANSTACIQRHQCRDTLCRQGLPPVTLLQLRNNVAMGDSRRLQLYQGQVDASEGMQPFELEGSKRKSTLAYIRHVIKYQVGHVLFASVLAILQPSPIPSSLLFRPSTTPPTHQNLPPLLAVVVAAIVRTALRAPARGSHSKRKSWTSRTSATTPMFSTIAATGSSCNPIL